MCDHAIRDELVRKVREKGRTAKGDTIGELKDDCDMSHVSNTQFRLAMGSAVYNTFELMRFRPLHGGWGTRPYELVYSGSSSS